MRRAEWLLAMLLPTLAFAQAPVSDVAPAAAPSPALVDAPRLVPPAPSVLPTASTPTRSARLLGASLAVVGVGVVAPLGAYLALTSLNSFVGFFAGFLTGTGVGVLLAPLAVILVGRYLGAEGGVGRAIVGALLGLVAGLLIGLPLATLPSAAYLVGLGLLWVLPSVGAVIGFEWGRAPPGGGGGVVLARF